MIDLYYHVMVLSFADWPKDHDFRFFKLEIIDIFLINWYGGAKPITVDEYLHAKS